MSNRITLIQLVSEQTMQNVLPILALRPHRTVHLATPKVANRCAWISRAAHHLNAIAEHDPEVITLTAMPSIPEVARVVLDVINGAKRDGFLPIVNFTGGTKLMSVGAFAAAGKCEVNSIYVDTENKVFVDGHTAKTLGDLLGQDMSLTSYQRQLTVNTIAVANGCGRVTDGERFEEYIDFGKYLLNDPVAEQELWSALDGSKGITPRGFEPRDRNELDAALVKPLAVREQTGKMAMAAKLTEQRGGAFVLPSNLNKAEFQRIRGMLTGGWWEVVIADAVKCAGRFRDVRWGAYAGDRGPVGSMEEDVLAVDGVQIAYFSCKRGGGGSKLSRQLEEMNQSAERLGGRFVSKFFCVCIRPAPQLYARAKQLNVRIITREDLVAGNPFKL